MRLPRWLYWVVGAAIAFAGAYLFRGLGDQFSIHQRWPFWLAGTAAIFVGLWVLSLGTKSRLNASSHQHRRKP
ncbi:MAG: hypothetical protein IPM60_03135 [Rhodospirillales bacterium]|nr:hypothetical protein [Rhodospirillales bacterium]